MVRHIVKALCVRLRRGLLAVLTGIYATKRATKNRAGTRSMFFLLSTLYFAVATPIRELDTPVLDTLSLER